MEEQVKVTGRLKWELIRDGKVVQSGERGNIITTVGKNFLAGYIAGTNANFVTHMAFGSGTTAVQLTDTALTTELAGNNYARVAVTKTNPSANITRYVATLTNINATVTVQEAGLMTALTAGILFAHQLTGAVTLSSTSDSLQVTWEVTFN